MRVCVCVFVGGGVLDVSVGVNITWLSPAHQERGQYKCTQVLADKRKRRTHLNRLNTDRRTAEEVELDMSIRYFHFNS